MKGFYQVTDTIKNQLLADVNVNNVTIGDISKVDLSKQTMFPLCHMIINSVTNEDSILRFNISVLAMDVLNVSKEEVVDIFRGNDNEQPLLRGNGFAARFPLKVWQTCTGPKRKQPDVVHLAQQ